MVMRMQRVGQSLKYSRTRGSGLLYPCWSRPLKPCDHSGIATAIHPQHTTDGVDQGNIHLAAASAVTKAQQTQRLGCGKLQYSIQTGVTETRSQHDGQEGQDPPPAILHSTHATKTDIRDRLREWSEEQARLAATDGIVSSLLDVLPLPNSVLLHETNIDVDASEFMALQENFMADGDVEAEYANNALVLEPGDVFRLTLKGAVMKFAIFLGMRQMKEGGLKPILLLEDGRWVVSPPEFPNTAILPSFSNPAEIKLLYSSIVSHPSIAQAEEEGIKAGAVVFGEMSTPLVKDVTGRLKMLYEEISSFQRQHRAELDILYDKFADEKDFNAFPLTMLVSVLFQKSLDHVSMGGRYAIFSELRKREGLHTIQRSRSGRVMVYFTPKMLYKRTLDVAQWAREYQDCAAQATTGKDVSAVLRANPLNTFVNKSRRIILKSRKIRSPTTIGSLGPSSTNQVHPDGTIATRESGETFTEADMSIIDFLWNTCLRIPRAQNDGTARSIASLILRAIGAYPKMRLGETIARLFFREMGLMSPWSEEVDEDLRIPAPGRRGSQLEQTLIKRTDMWCDSLGFNSDPTAIPLQDTMADLRKDWDHATIYCIDKPSSIILDDGISIEESLEIPGATWVHVHIAHPSAFIAPTSRMGQRAQALTTSIYTLGKVYPMFPAGFLNSLSLKKNSPVMTVSSLILENGQVHDVAVAAGTIRDVVRLDPSEVQEFLGVKQLEEAFLQVGPTISSQREPDMQQFEDVQLHEKFIRKLNSVLKARADMRRKEATDYPTWRVNFSSCHEHVSWVEAFDDTRHSRSYHYLGDPTIKIVAPRPQGLPRWSEADPSETSLTAGAMILAGESVGQWLKDRRIPAVYAGTSFVTEEHNISTLNSMPEDQLFHFMPKARHASGPISHALLGVGQYVKITSPLRRYNDNVAQWQINAFLRAEANGESTSSADVEALLPFSRKEVDSLIGKTDQTLKLMNRLRVMSAAHWAMQALFRAFHFNEAPLPPVWDVRVHRVDVPIQHSVDAREGIEFTAIVATLLPFNHRARLIKSKEGWEDGVTRFQYLPVKIEYVDTTEQEVYVKAVGPASDEATQKEAIRCIKAENEKPPGANSIVGTG